MKKLFNFFYGFPVYIHSRQITYLVVNIGDVGYYDKDGYFYIVDRVKELIKYKAYQVAPAELEGLILSMPQVDDVGVTWIPDVMAGELPIAFVVKKSNASITASQIQEYVAGRSGRTFGSQIFTISIPCANAKNKCLIGQIMAEYTGHPPVRPPVSFRVARKGRGVGIFTKICSGSV